MGGQQEQRLCAYCKSPIPAGWDKCKSCSMSGELPKPDLGLALKRPAQGTSPVVVVLLVVGFFAIAGTAAYLYAKRSAKESSAPSGH